MAATDVQFQADQGTPDQLPRGAAQQLNAVLPDNPGSPPGLGASPPGEPAQQPDTSVQPASPADFNPAYTPASADEEFITGPTMRPNEPVTAGALPPASGPLPENLRRALPALVDAANAPGASDNLKTLVAFLVREASR